MLGCVIAIALSAGQPRGITISEVAGPIAIRLRHSASHDVPMYHEDDTVLAGIETTAIDWWFVEHVAVGAGWSLAYASVGGDKTFLHVPELRLTVSAPGERIQLGARITAGSAFEAAFNGRGLMLRGSLLAGVETTQVRATGKAIPVVLTAELGAMRAVMSRSALELVVDDTGSNAVKVERVREAVAVLLTFGVALKL